MAARNAYVRNGVLFIEGRESRVGKPVHGWKILGETNVLVRFWNAQSENFQGEGKYRNFAWWCHTLWNPMFKN